ENEEKQFSDRINKNNSNIINKTVENINSKGIITPSRSKTPVFQPPLEDRPLWLKDLNIHDEIRDLLDAVSAKELQVDDVKLRMENISTILLARLLPDLNDISIAI